MIAYERSGAQLTVERVLVRSDGEVSSRRHVNNNARNRPSDPRKCLSRFILVAEILPRGGIHAAQIRPPHTAADAMVKGVLVIANH